MTIQMEIETTDITIRDETSIITTTPLSNRYQLAATSDNTRRAYQADIRHFETWGGQLPTSTESILRYMHAYAETLNPRTLSRHLTALKQWHRYQHFPDPTASPIVNKTMTGISRLHGKPKDKAPPLLPEYLTVIARHLTAQDTPRGYRNNAILQIGFLGAFRRSELAVIRLEDINWHSDGIEILIPKSKTDQLNEGQFCVIPNGNEHLCAVRALKTWLEKSNITNGYIFRRIDRQARLSNTHISSDSINDIIKQSALAAGIENATTFSSHSMRRGLATTACRNGASLPSIMRQGRWKQVGTVMEYVEAAQRFEENAAGNILQKLK